MTTLLRPYRMSPAGWLGIAALAGVAAANVAVLTMPMETAPLQARGGVSPGVMSAIASGAGRTNDIGALDRVVARPLFNPDRRPLVRAVAASDAPPAEAVSLELVGVREDVNGRRKALIRAAEQPAAWVDAGGQIEGWRVSRIEASRVLVEGGSGTVELRLYRAQ